MNIDVIKAAFSALVILCGLYGLYECHMLSKEHEEYEDCVLYGVIILTWAVVAASCIWTI